MFVEKIGTCLYDVSHMALDQPEAHQYYKHMHYYCELLLFLEGDADFFIDGVQYHLQPYDLLLIPKGTYHYLILRSAARYENYVCNFFDTILTPEQVKQLFRQPNVFNIRADEELLHFFRLFDIYYNMYSREDFCQSVEYLMREILLYCCYAPRVSRADTQEQNILVQKIIRYVDSHTEEPLDARIVACRLKVSRSHIQNVFSQSMQIGLKQYIMQKKIMAAHHDLMKGNPATEVAAKYHFNDYSTFFRAYKKIFGCAPSSVRRKSSGL